MAEHAVVKFSLSSAFQQHQFQSKTQSSGGTRVQAQRLRDSLIFKWRLRIINLPRSLWLNTFTSPGFRSFQRSWPFTTRSILLMSRFNISMQFIYFLLIRKNICYIIVILDYMVVMWSKWYILDCASSIKGDKILENTLSKVKIHPSDSTTSTLLLQKGPFCIYYLLKLNYWLYKYYIIVFKCKEWVTLSWVW